MNIIMTGCSSGFGEHILEKLEMQGNKVFGVGLEGPDLRADFSSEDMSFVAEQAYNNAEALFQGPIHCLINNAGATHIAWVETHPVRRVEELMRINVCAPYAFIREMVHRITRYEREDPEKDPWKGRIVNTCSMSSKMGLRACPGYPASKAALEAMTRSLAKEFAGRHPISVFGIAPGAIEDSGMVNYAIQRLQETRSMTKEEAEKYNQQSPLGRYCTWDEIWTVFDHVVNDAPEFATGNIYYMPNGMGI